MCDGGVDSICGAGEAEHRKRSRCWWWRDDDEVKAVGAGGRRGTGTDGARGESREMADGRSVDGASRARPINICYSGASAGSD